MAILAGIDEAGFGPVLGPLVVSAVVFQVDDAAVEADLWKALAPAVARTPAKRHVGLVVGDSKRLYTPAGGLVHVERGVLGFLSLAGQPVGALRQLLGWLSPAAVGAMEAYPWYREGDLPLPREADPTDLRLRGNALRTALAAARVTWLGAAARVLHAGHLNRLFAATDNKATTLCDQTFGLIDWVWRNRPAGRSVRVVVDRQGGRLRYLPILQRMYPDGGSFRILAEASDHSGYRMTTGRETLEVHFLRKGEGLHLPVALASMVSKYVRELFMVLLNRFWAEHMGDGRLRPTAGYHTDGHRFLAEIASVRRNLGIPDVMLIRSR